LAAIWSAERVGIGCGVASDSAWPDPLIGYLPRLGIKRPIVARRIDVVDRQWDPNISCQHRLVLPARRR
jgi:hypothetical protein